MAVDLSFQFFSIDLFYRLFDKKTPEGNFSSRVRKCNEAIYDYKCSDIIVNAVRCREIFFHNTLDTKLRADIGFFSESTIDFYMYLQNNMTIFIAFNELSVFDKLFMTCAATSLMALYCDSRNIEAVSLCWAMYFDTNFSKEFYKKGGWEKLEESAASYIKDFIMFYSDENEHYYNNDFFKARDCFEIQSSNYSTSMLISRFQYEMLKSENTTCPECLIILRAADAIYCESVNNFDEYKFCECYFQILKLMLSKEELSESEEEIFSDPKMEDFSEIIDIVRNPAEGRHNPLFDDQFTFQELCGVFEQQIKDLNATKLLTRIFKYNSELSDKQCKVCGSNVVINESESLVSESDQIEEIKSVIGETLIDVGGKKEAFDADKNQKPTKENDEILRLFFTLGVKPVCSDILESLNRTKEKKNMEEMNNSPAAMHTRKTTEDEIKENKRKKKNKKKKKNAMSSSH